MGEDKPAVGRYGEALLESLKEDRPEYERPKAEKSLAQLAADMNERAESQFQNLLAQLRKQRPLPASTNYLDRVQHESGLAQQARELVDDELLGRGAEDAGRSEWRE